MNDEGAGMDLGGMDDIQPLLLLPVVQISPCGVYWKFDRGPDRHRVLSDLLNITLTAECRTDFDDATRLW